PTEYAGHGEERARRACDAGRPLVIAAGGDGTVAEVAAGLVGGHTALGIMPLGSVMNVARMLGVPRELPAAALVIRDDHRVCLDVGKARTTVGERIFLEAAGVGIDAALFAYVNQLDSGNWKSFKPLPRFLWRWRPRRVRITVDGRTKKTRVLMVAIVNGPYLGAAVEVAPQALADDGLLEVYAYTAHRGWQQLVHLWSLLRRGGRQMPGVMSTQARTVEIYAPRPLMVHADSHPLGTTPASFTILPRALEVLVPRRPVCAPALQYETIEPRASGEKQTALQVAH
ncbi:MAG: diacylglycerol kinase family lipid kinase, partial [Chloroflexi bacterium]|nr:diacylglycerol kinase family lipid kinase [Chloroflexota bacterium]